MNVEFKSSFARDLRAIKDKRLRAQVRELIVLMESVQSIRDIPDLSKISGYAIYYRIRLGDYRLGLSIEADTLILMRFLHRRDIYRYFP